MAQFVLVNVVVAVLMKHLEVIMSVVFYISLTIENESNLTSCLASTKIGKLKAVRCKILYTKRILTTCSLIKIILDIGGFVKCYHRFISEL